MSKILTKEDLLQIKLHLSETDYQMLKSREKEWYPHPHDPELSDLTIAYLDKWEWEKLNDPKWPSCAGYGDL
ncbi:MAG: hypothetical protein J5621_08595 [Paludibacteraceae bacterium]|nr:hypothetical protein [Paludibacteraceae bacterium]